jgi:uncharacterized protein (TIGR02001 family)
MHRNQLILRNLWRRLTNIARGSRIPLAILLLFACGAAWGQTSGSVSVVSNYLFRGISLSEGNPVPQVNLSYDSPAGWYAGGFASRIALEGNPGTAQLVGYAGYSRRWLNGLSWETGATATQYLQNTAEDYMEVFAGLGSEHFSGRVYASPNYLGQNVRSLYAELNADYPFLERFHLLAHVGYLRVPPVSFATVSTRFDSRVGISAGLRDWNFQLSWVAIERSSATYPYYTAPNPHAAVLSVSYSF